VRRRQFITLLSGAAAWPVAARAQPAERVRGIGVFVGAAEDDRETKVRLAAFRQGLEKLGWSEGRNYRIDTRFSPAGIQADVLAKELLAFQPDVILAHTTPLVAAIRRENQAIPIVFIFVSDPIGSGFVASLARPGGNTTGLLLYEDGLIGKCLAMLKEIEPRLARVAFMANPKTTPYDYFWRMAETVAPSLSIELVPTRVETAVDIERTISTFARMPNGGLILPSDSTTNFHRDLIIALAARYSLPAVYQTSYWVAAGGLMSYGTHRIDQFRQAALYIDRILRGTHPAGLPVQGPIKYETAINLKTARTLGLTVPPALLVAA
jgi:putative ABC transport system substrate-binding protein